MGSIKRWNPFCLNKRVGFILETLSYPPNKTTHVRLSAPALCPVDRVTTSPGNSAKYSPVDPMRTSRIPKRWPSKQAVGCYALETPTRLG